MLSILFQEKEFELPPSVLAQLKGQLFNKYEWRGGGIDHEWKTRFITPYTWFRMMNDLTRFSISEWSNSTMMPSCSFRRWASYYKNERKNFRNSHLFNVRLNRCMLIWLLQYWNAIDNKIYFSDRRQQARTTHQVPRLRRRCELIFLSIFHVVKDILPTCKLTETCRQSNYAKASDIVSEDHHSRNLLQVRAFRLKFEALSSSARSSLIEQFPFFGKLEEIEAMVQVCIYEECSCHTFPPFPLTKEEGWVALSSCAPIHTFCLNCPCIVC